MPASSLAKLLLAATLLVPAALLAADGAAEPAHCDDQGEHHAKHHGDKAAHSDMRAQLEAEFVALGLTNTQKQDLGTLVQLYAERLQAIATRGDTDRRELLELSPLDPDYDTLTNQVSQEAANAAGDVVNVLSELQRTAFLLLSNAQQDALLVLRAEQQQAVRERIAEMQAERSSSRPGLLP
jgi:hypothetical protein